jgi:hypothetical protein
MDDDKDNDATDPKLISSYTRSEALADGVLVDVTETAREAGFVVPVALTRAAWDLCVALSPAAERACNDERGRCYAERGTMPSLRRNGAFERGFRNGPLRIVSGRRWVASFGWPSR